MVNESIESEEKPSFSRRGFLKGALKTAAVATIGATMPSLVEAITKPGTLEDRRISKELSGEIQTLENRRGNITLHNLFELANNPADTDTDADVRAVLQQNLGRAASMLEWYLNVYDPQGVDYVPAANFDLVGLTTFSDRENSTPHLKELVCGIIGTEKLDALAASVAAGSKIKVDAAQTWESAFNDYDKNGLLIIVKPKGESSQNLKSLRYFIIPNPEAIYEGALGHDSPPSLFGESYTGKSLAPPVLAMSGKAVFVALRQIANGETNTPIKEYRKRIYKILHTFPIYVKFPNGSDFSSGFDPY